MYARKILSIMSIVCLFFLLACGPKPVAPKAELDTPEHHVITGNKLLKAGEIDKAFKEFDRAKMLDPEYSPAHVGLGLVCGLNGDFKKGFAYMDKAEDYAKEKNHAVTVNIGYMRLYILGKEKVDKKWLNEVENYYKDAIKLAPDCSEAHFYMGIAYKMSYNFQKAAEQFTKVLNLNKGFVEEADKEYAIIQKIERAMPGTSVGKKIALLEKITRADVAALFIEELRVDELFKNRTPKEFDTSFKSPEKEFKTGEYIKIPPATDIADHVLKADIDAVMEIGIKGLQPYPDHTFKPYEMINRAEFAMMIEDIMIKITGVEGLATRFIGSVSPFTDLRNDLPYFNAVILCTTRGIMVAKDLISGEFDAMGDVSGAEALLSLRVLRTQLEKY
ncbi:MAG: S-layer homology domain-containing protein [Proteobacteria bacterium]|nr:S-layer homology domain-containing protein [Pseudomonadota bacterium]MBU4389061.1 S-layer homology domain-containing protein [Pseudomonadota bacterium]MBU4420739.1 S-layer homology domain-containing protein [Pseudomonadota bacterium]MBU4503146.1 S-layer homology domain-containing protein [Pseudomonadota bacterium]MCG2829936.1 S-layer homology domain-containing protein [Desulfobacteraceae bacterium]